MKGFQEQKKPEKQEQEKKPTTRKTTVKKKPGQRPAYSDTADYESLGDGWGLFISFVRVFPDFLVDLFLSDDSNYGGLTLLQRVIMRAKARYQYCDITGCRGMTKTYTSFLEEFVEMIVWPGTRTAYYGPSHKQMADIASQVYPPIEHDYPGLCDYLTKEAESLDRFELSTPFGSTFTIAANRGGTVHKVVAEEFAQEEYPQFDYAEYKRVVLPMIRDSYTVKGAIDPYYILYKQQFITSASRRQNHAYEIRCQHLTMMQRGESAFVMDVPYDAVLLSGMRDVNWAETLHTSLSPDEWAREMESRYTGADENPIISDTALSESRCLAMMEEHHCCKDADNKLMPDEVIYIVAYDVSYADGAKNAKCACVVIKCTRQKEWLKRDKFMKQVVWVDDWAPMNAGEQAKKLKTIWNRFCYPGSETYIVLDAWQYGSSVLQSLMTDLGDGLAPLCIYDHKSMTEYELEDALPCIYPIKAAGVGTTDPDAEMIRYAELQFEYRNVQLLTSNFQTGLKSYKNFHRIKDDNTDYVIYKPYKKTNELVGQIQNLKKVPNAAGVSEKRISKSIQRDSWSALKYGLRFAQILERNMQLANVDRNSDWKQLVEQFEHGNGNMFAIPTRTRTVTGRHGGRIA